MNLQIKQINMIKQQLRTGDILSEAILALYDQIPRDEFVPGPFKPFAYSDMQIELNHHQRMMTPLEEAKLLQALHLSGTETVLEVGTGSGFLTALLSRKCKKVMSIGNCQDLTSMAKEKLHQHQCNNVELFTGNAYQGWFDRAPYDVIIFTSGLETLTETQKLQVTPGGQLFAIIGRNPIMQGQLHRLDHDHSWSIDVIFETCLPPLINPIQSHDFIF